MHKSKAKVDKTFARYFELKRVYTVVFLLLLWTRKRKNVGILVRKKKKSQLLMFGFA